MGGAYLSGLFSPRQPETVALDVGFSGMRFALVLLALFWVQDLIGKEIERRTTILYLAYPLPRAHYIIGRFFGIIFLLLIASIVLALVLWLAAIFSSQEYTQAHRGNLGLPYWLTVIGIWLNVVTVAAFAICIATISTVPALPLTLGAAFSIAGQSLGAVFEYLGRGADGRTDLVSQYGPILEVSRWILPDLSRLDWRVWAMYDQSIPMANIALASLMAVSYACLLLLIGIQAFNQREFD